jgi:hypothetical protein
VRSSHIFSLVLTKKINLLCENKRRYNVNIEDTNTLPGFSEDDIVRTMKKNVRTAPGIGHNSQVKSAKERAKEHYDRKKAAGWRKTWVNPETLKLADHLGGIEGVAADRAELTRKIEEQTEQLDALRSRSLWSRIMNKKS